MKRAMQGGRARRGRITAARGPLPRSTSEKNAGRAARRDVRVATSTYRGRPLQKIYRALPAAAARGERGRLRRSARCCWSTCSSATTSVREHYRRRFRHMLVDEFQDTNPVQYELLRLLAPPRRRTSCVVGDDDQSIYRWRGADVDNILDFDARLPRRQVVKLEQNYRSDQNILDAAHAVIAQQPRRDGEEALDRARRGEPLQLLVSRDERGEAQEIARADPERSRARARAVRARSPSSTGRTRRAACSRRRCGWRACRTRWSRGRSFYERAEVKDAAAYLRLMVNPRSDADLLRVINTPARGIGDTTVERLRAFASEKEISLFEAASAPVTGTLNSGARRRLKGFSELVEKLGDEAARAEDANTARVEDVRAHRDARQQLRRRQRRQAQERAENLKEFLGAAIEFDRIRAEEGGATARSRKRAEAGPGRRGRGRARRGAAVARFSSAGRGARSHSRSRRVRWRRSSSRSASLATSTRAEAPDAWGR